MSASIAAILAVVMIVVAVALFLRGRMVPKTVLGSMGGSPAQADFARQVAAEQKAHEKALMDSALAMVSEFSNDADSVEQVAGAASQALLEALGVPRVTLIKRDGDNWIAQAADTGESAVAPIPDAARVFTMMGNNPEAVFLGGGEQTDVRQPIVDLGRFYTVDTLIPLAHRGELLALLLLAPRSTGRPYSVEEKNFIGEIQIRAAAAAANASFLSEIATRAKLASEVNVALEVQRELLPRKSEATLGGFNLAGHYKAGENSTGSDFWTYHHLPDGRVLVLVGNVAGDGLAASMTAAVTLGACDVLLKLEEVPDAGRLLAQLNLALYLPDVKSWVSCCAALFNHKNMTVSFANAGNPFPYVLSNRNGQVRTGCMVARGPAVGDRPYGKFDPVAQPLAKGDSFIFYTRGFVEHSDSSGKSYGERRFQRALALGTERGLDSRGLRDKILLDVTSWARGAAGRDDEVMVVVRAE